MLIMLPKLKKNTNLINNKKNLILDIGGGYGGLARLLKNIYHDSTFIIIELPELCMLSAYFLKETLSIKILVYFQTLKINQRLHRMI